MGTMMSCCTSRGDVAGNGYILFITAENLKKRLEDKVTPVYIIDCRRGADKEKVEKSYNDHHIPGAHYFNMSQWTNFA